MWALSYLRNANSTQIVGSFFKTSPERPKAFLLRKEKEMESKRVCAFIYTLCCRVGCVVIAIGNAEFLSIVGSSVFRFRHLLRERDVAVSLGFRPAASPSK